MSLLILYLIWVPLPFLPLPACPPLPLSAPIPCIPEVGVVPFLSPIPRFIKKKVAPSGTQGRQPELPPLPKISKRDSKQSAAGRIGWPGQHCSKSSFGP